MVRKARLQRRQAAGRGPDAALAGIDAAFAEGCDMLAWPDDWNGEGSPRYQEATWARAKAFVRDLAARLWATRGIEVPPPEVLPGLDGAINLEWRTRARELSLIVPAAPDGPIEVFGDRSSPDAVGGGLSVEQAAALLRAWMLP